MYQDILKHNHMNVKKKMKIYQIKEGYCYNSDSLLLYDFILPHIRHNDSLLDIGSGSGVIGMLCYKAKNIKLYQLEKQPEYVLFNAKNAKINNIDSVIIHADCNVLSDSKNILMQLQENMLCNYNKLKGLINMQIAKFTQFNDSQNLSKSFSLHSSQTDLIKHSNTASLTYFDIIVSNPPFYQPNTLQSQNLLKSQATQSRYLPLESILKLASKILKPHGKFIFCYSPSVIGEVLKKLKEFGFGVLYLRFVYPHIDRDAKLILICAKLNSKAQTRILPPLITHVGTNQGDNTEEVRSIYKFANIHSIKISYNDIEWGNFMQLTM